MIRLKLYFTLCLILSALQGFSQASGDSIVCITAHQVRVINLAFNDMERMSKKIVITDSLIGTKDLKISLLTQAEQARAEQLILANTELKQKDSDIKKLKRTILVYKIGAVVAVLTTILLLR